MSRVNELNAKYIELCKTYGHLAYNKKSLEQQMLDLENQLSTLSALVKEAQAKEQQDALTALKAQK